jgi:hypothetical protein
MDDKDRVFARFQDAKPVASDRREMLTIPRRAGAAGTRVVEVVHVKSDTMRNDRPRRADAQMRAASWDRGFPLKPPAVPAPEAAPIVIPPPTPTVHVMRAWEPPAMPVPVAAIPAVRVGAPAKPRAGMERRVADPFDAADDGANCMRCGYAIEPAREKRGLLSCASCG